MRNMLYTIWGDLIPGFYTSPKENHTAYATTWVFSPYEQPLPLAVKLKFMII